MLPTASMFAQSDFICSILCVCVCVCVCVLRFDIRSSTHNTQNTSLHSCICVPSPSTYNLNTVFGIESIWLFIISVCDAISQCVPNSTPDDIMAFLSSIVVYLFIYIMKNQMLWFPVYVKVRFVILNCVRMWFLDDSDENSSYWFCGTPFWNGTVNKTKRRQ